MYGSGNAKPIKSIDVFTKIAVSLKRRWFEPDFLKEIYSILCVLQHTKITALLNFLIMWPFRIDIEFVIYNSDFLQGINLLTLLFDISGPVPVHHATQYFAKKDALMEII